jgi:2'-5' RNA ligase
MGATSKLDWRIFCAIELPATARALVLRHIADLKETVLDVRASWARETNLHLTLKFLGEIPQAAVADFSTSVSRAVAGVTPFSIRLEQTGAFPTHGQPRVLWIGIDDGAGKLAEMNAKVEEESALEGFAGEPRPFHPHLTIARLRNPQHARALATAHKRMKFEPVEIPVSDLLVIRSELSVGGSEYSIVSRHALDSPISHPQITQITQT